MRSCLPPCWFARHAMPCRKRIPRSKQHLTQSAQQSGLCATLNIYWPRALPSRSTETPQEGHCGLPHPDVILTSRRDQTASRLHESSPYRDKSHRKSGFATQSGIFRTSDHPQTWPCQETCHGRFKIKGEANGRFIDRLAHRVASVTSVRPNRCRSQMARLQSGAAVVLVGIGF